MEEKTKQNLSPPASLPARRVVLGVEWHGVRMDRFLKSALENVPLSAIHRLLRTGQVRLNGGRVKGDARLQNGDEVRIPPLRPAEERQETVIQVPSRVVTLLRERILYRDARVLVLDKPVGMAVHSGSGQSWGVVDAVREMLVQEGGQEIPELGHRLDRDTSGCLILGLDKVATRFIAEKIRQHKVEKEYLVLVRGHLATRSGTITAPLVKGMIRGGERVVVSPEKGESAVTHYRVVQKLRGASLVAAILETGRTHQIRVHFQHLGHPVAGDDKYGDREFNKAMRQAGLNRMFLHAARLTLPHPDQGTIQVEAPLDEVLQTTLKRLALGS